jgi:lipopolysaccharide export system permease protein
MLPVTLSRYIGRHFLQSILLALGGIMCVIMLIDTVELLKRTSSKTGVGFSAVLEMVLMKSPEMVSKILPFSVLVGGMMALIRLNRSSELVIARSAGLSVWQFLRPAWIVAIALGVFFVAVFNPISAAMLERFEKMEARYISGKPSLLALSNSGLWLRDFTHNDSGEQRERIFHALRLSQQDMTLKEVIIFQYNEESKFLGRIDASSAKLRRGFWSLENVVISQPGQPSRAIQSTELDTSLTLEQIQDSFAPPGTLSVWELPNFITLLEESGFSAIRHRIHWQATLATPLMLVGMIFIAAIFSLRLPRRGGLTPLIAAGVITSFIIYFLSDIIYALGMSGSLPVLLAAWIPALVPFLIGIWMMIHLEY